MIGRGLDNPPFQGSVVVTAGLVVFALFSLNLLSFMNSSFFGGGNPAVFLPVTLVGCGG